ncbi:uncharacterized protein RSE6_08084 [Rhynchosporium secalis]|uniref:Uncharacterized protein n=1 Tax=Rhynchosporium secalis TaxID=38038 RepID=A0A1E1MEL5_RHYSE|nr:uncharacterized protein RSE6_08084 [Rhynchosporium secalis]
MKIPPGFLDAKGKVAKGDFSLTRGDDHIEVKEFGAVSEGRKISCYVLTSPGDILTLSFALRADIANHADFVVDGILRNCRPAPASRSFNGTFEKAVYQGWKSEMKRAAVKYSRMRVKERGNAENMFSTNSDTPSTVGSLEVRLYRTHARSSAGLVTNSDANAPAPAHNDRAPAFDKFGEWYEANSNVNFVGPPPPFCIELFDHNQVGRIKKERILKDLPENHELWATFIFHLRSAEYLRQLGFGTSLGAIATDPSMKTSVARKEESELRSDATSIEKALVEDNTGDCQKKAPKHAELLKNKAVPRPAPILAPPTTVTGLLNALSSARDGSPEPLPATTVFKNSKGAILLKQEAMDELQKFQEPAESKTAILRGVGGLGTSPAHQAFLQKASTLQGEILSPTPTQDEPSRNGGNGAPQTRPASQRTIDAIFSPTKLLFSQPRESAEEMLALSKKSEDRLSKADSQHLKIYNNNLNFVKPAYTSLNNPRHDSPRQIALSIGLSEVSDSPTEVADPQDIARAVKSSQTSSQRTTQDTNTSHAFQLDQVGLGISHGPLLKIKSIEYEQGNHTYLSPLLGTSQYPTPNSNIGSPLHKFHTARGLSFSNPREPLREQWQRPALGSVSSSSPKPRQETPQNLQSQVPRQSDLRSTTPLKRKSDYLTGNSTPDVVSPRNLSRSPSVMNAEFEHDKAAAEARFATAERKREELQQRLGNALDLKREMGKIREINQRAADVERQNAEMEAEIELLNETNIMD